MKINNIYTNIYDQKFNIAHQSESFMDMKRIIALFNPELILDFGTYIGGTVAMFHDCCQNAEIHTYDNNRYKVVVIKILNKNIHYHVEDILNTPSKNLIKLLKSKKRKFIYCDNGNKPKEMNMVVPLVNSGDLIGVHDWGTEIKEIDIFNIIHLLDPVESDWFEANKWLTRFWKKI